MWETLLWGELLVQLASISSYCFYFGYKFISAKACSWLVMVRLFQVQARMVVYWPVPPSPWAPGGPQCLGKGPSLRTCGSPGRGSQLRLAPGSAHGCLSEARQKLRRQMQMDKKRRWEDERWWIIMLNGNNTCKWICDLQVTNTCMSWHSHHLWFVSKQLLQMFGPR